MAKLECTTPTETGSIVVDWIMLVIATLSLLSTGYGLYQYITHYRPLPDDKKPPKPLFIIGLIFFIISSFTLFNALLYDVFYLTCRELDDYEGPIYHTCYFMQIYTLWLTLFCRLYYVFKESSYRLKKLSIYLYYAAFISVALCMIPMYIIFDLEAESFITLPYVTLSIAFNISLLVAFIYKLYQLLHDMQSASSSPKGGIRGSYKKHTDPLLIIMTKNTLLAVISILCTFLVIIVLIYLYARHKGHYERHSDMEEFVLEFVILVDIVSNFICILLSYQFFDNEYNRFCKCCNHRLHKYLHIEMDKKMKKIHSKRTTTNINGSSHVPSNSPESVDVYTVDGSMDVDETEMDLEETTRTITTKPDSTHHHIEVDESTLTQNDIGNN